MVPVVVLAGLLVFAVVVLLYQGAAILFAVQMPRLDPTPDPAGARRRPRLSVIIAARDEVDDLPACLEALRVQEYPDLEVIVVDGGSTDGTREAVRDRFGSVRLLEEPPLPEGWVGKNWACDVGYRASSGELLLFLDADVRLAPSALRVLVDWADAQRSDLTSLAPRVETVGFWERVILPFYTQMVLTYFRAPRANRDTSRAAIANGQCWLTTRASYERAGGHAAVRGYILEDIRIAQRYRAAGLRIRIAWAPELAVTRMYRHRAEMFEGLLKNVHGTDFSASRQVGFLAALIGLFWLPLGVLPYGVAASSPVLIAVGGFLYLALFAKHAGFAGAIGTSWPYGLLFPLAVGFYVVLVTTSISRGLRGERLTWKGRAYSSRPG
ncbi:MAG TPA: glycosyltransferase family 2 protein [Thermoplasmata archaeon]|nr:glycosyltransferase family 2 protein [Thermoplasmata archaeon]